MWKSIPFSNCPLLHRGMFVSELKAINGLASNDQQPHSFNAEVSVDKAYFHLALAKAQKMLTCRKSKESYN